MDVFRWCMNWVKVNSMDEKITRQSVHLGDLGDLFQNIRFGSMANEHLPGVLATHGDLFSIDEYQEFVQLIESKDFHSTLLKAEPRPLPWDNDDVIEFELKSTYLRWSYIQKFERFTFSTNEHTLLGEIVFNRADFLEISVELLLFERSLENDQILRNIGQEMVESRFLFDTRLKITLQKPIILKPNILYEVQIKIDSSPSDSEYASALNRKYCETINIEHMSAEISFVHSLRLQKPERPYSL